MNVHACLAVDARHEKVLVTFKIENRGERRVWLPRAIAADTALRGRLFDVRAFPGDAPVAYIGPAGQQAARGVEDYVEVAPHSFHAHTIDITRFYAFAPGEHTYQIRYAGQVMGDIRQPEVLTALSTEPVMFLHIAP
jgi:hypothetical protein